MKSPEYECFVVGVIGQDGSAERTHADWLIDGIISPVFRQHFTDFKVLRADRMNKPGIITSQIIEKLLNARLVIADMTFLNANAFYEIGIRHMTGLPIIHAHRDGDTIPFDVSTFLSMSFSLTRHQDVISAQASLKTLVNNVLEEGYIVENPVTQARGRAQFAETASAPDRLLLAEIESLRSRMNAIENYTDESIWPHTRAKERNKILSGEFGVGASSEKQRATLKKFIDASIKPNLGGNLILEEDDNTSWITVRYSEEYHGFAQQLMKHAEKLGLDIIPF
jgi:hypothetical protein